MGALVAFFSILNLLEGLLVALVAQDLAPADVFLLVGFSVSRTDFLQGPSGMFCSVQSFHPWNFSMALGTIKGRVLRWTSHSFNTFYGRGAPL